MFETFPSYYKVSSTTKGSVPTYDNMKSSYELTITTIPLTANQLITGMPTILTFLRFLYLSWRCAHPSNLHGFLLLMPRCVCTYYSLLLNNSDNNFPIPPPRPRLWFANRPRSQNLNY